MQIVAATVLGIIFNLLLQCIEANLALDFKVTKISANHKPADCNVANTTYAHGVTFKLDCKTQCVCENGRHACSTLCPKEQLPAPEDTISCRSPRLVEVPGHCCKMWLCENPTADVYATCHNSSTSPWTPCSRVCGLGISTRFTATTAGCNQLSNLRLCENRKCETQQNNSDKQRTQMEWHPEAVTKETKEEYTYLMKANKLKYKLKNQQRQQKHYVDRKHQQRRQQQQQQQVQEAHLEHEHRIRKGHECRSLQRLGPARIRLGECISKKLYRPKICGRCHQNTKCCVPSVSTTIQVELLCPLNAMDPISFVQQQLKTQQQQQQHQHHGQILYPETSATSLHSSPSSSSSSSPPSPTSTSLWDTQSLDAIDQEYLQSHQIKIANKFIAVEWILKCECSKNDNCQRIVNTTTTATLRDDSGSRNSSSSNINNRRYHDYDDNENVETGNYENMQNINYFKRNHNNNNSYKKRTNSMIYEDYKQQQLAEGAATQIVQIPDDNKNVDEHDNVKQDVNENENNADNDGDRNINNSYSNSNRHIKSFNRKKQTKDYAGYNKHYKNNNSYSYSSSHMINNQNVVGGNEQEEEVKDEKDNYLHNEDIEEKEWSTSLSNSLSSAADGVATTSEEIQPDIIPYPPPPFSANKHTTGNSNKNINSNGNSNSNSNKNKKNNRDDKNNNLNTKTNWINEKFKHEHSKQNKQQQQLLEQQQHQQQLYEHWLLQQYNNRPYQTETVAT